jgi:hypothetical protein
MMSLMTEPTSSQSAEPASHEFALASVMAARSSQQSCLFAFTGYPHEIWRQIWSNNPLWGSRTRSWCLTSGFRLLVRTR